ncbi:MAG: response regulator [Gammaproteobacteria bacterium]
MHTLLIVDDEADIVASLHRQFRKDYHVITATSGSEAIDCLAREKIDLIICDQRMPGISGDQVLKEALQRQPEAIRILLTGYADVDSLMRCVNEAQIYKYLAKPWEPEMLRLTVVRALESLELQRQKHLVTTAFSQYVNPDIVAAILRDPSQLRLGGERKELTLFFSDLADFSGLAEHLNPEILTVLLNRYLSDMTEIILQEGGTLDKYEGDAIVAFWNAPLDQPDHAVRACRAALRCQRRIVERAAEYRRLGGRELRARIGIHSGEVVVGNMGSDARFNYSVLGDAANLAARLENANKAFATQIMVSQATWEQLPEPLPGREIGLLKVAGRSAPVYVYELSEMLCDEALRHYEDGLVCMRERQWENAAQSFERLPDDVPARVYATQCRRMLAGEEWDGLWDLTVFKRTVPFIAHG